MRGGIAAALAAAWLLAAPARAQEAEPAPARVAPADIEAGLRRYSHEPTVDEVVEAALRARSSSPSRVRDAMDRARATGWLPTARASIRRGQAVDLRGLADGDPNTISTDDDLSFDASLVFRFDRIVFASEETSLLRELRVVEETRQELVRLVVHLYFERRRLQLERDLAGRTDVDRAVRILELSALLDAFTDGAFPRIMGRGR